MAHFLFNVVGADASARDRAVASLRAGTWRVGADERHGSALAAGDLVLLYLGAPERLLIGRATLASAVHPWTAAEGAAPGGCCGGVTLAHVEEWHPPVPMRAVLARLDRSGGARADFDTGVVSITANEYRTALAVAAEMRGGV